MPLSDNAGNFISADLVTLGFPTKLMVISQTDNTPPWLLTFDFVPTEINTSADGPADVVITFTATDDLSGVKESGALNFVSESGDQTVQAIASEVPPRSGNPEVVTFKATATFPPYSEAGTWTIFSVPLSDNAGNFFDSVLATLGFPTEVIIADSPSADLCASYPCGTKSEKVSICHKGRRTLCIGKPSVASHMAHGDRCGPCDV